MKIKLFWEDRNLIEEVESDYIPDKHLVYQDLFIEIVEKVLVVREDEAYVMMVCVVSHMDSDDEIWDLLGYGKEEPTS